MDDQGQLCAVCKQRPASRRYAAHVREDGPIEDARVCAECYLDLIQIDKLHAASQHG